MIMFDRRSLAGWFELRNALTILTDLWRQPGDPAAAFGVDRLHPVLFWTLSVVIMIMIVVGYLWFARMAYRLFGPTGSGFASRADIARDLSLTACRVRGEDHPARPRQEAPPPGRAGAAGYPAAPGAGQPGRPVAAAGERHRSDRTATVG